MVVAVGGLTGAYYYLGLSGPQEGPAAQERENVSGLEISRQALNFIDENLRDPAGGYEEYVMYEGGAEKRSSGQEDESDDAKVQQFMDGRLYMVYAELADATGSPEYSGAADSRFSAFYEACKTDPTCKEDGYEILQTEWERTGNPEYRDMIDAMTSYDREEHMDEGAPADEGTTLSPSDIFGASINPEDCDFANAVLSTGLQETDLAPFEGFAGRIHSVFSEEPSQRMSALASCGNLMARLSDLSGKGEYREMAKGALRTIYERHPDFKELEAGSDGNLHITDDVVSVALLAARLHDAEIGVTGN